MNKLKLLTFISSVILSFALIISYVYISAVTSYLYKYKPLYSYSLSSPRELFITKPKLTEKELLISKPKLTRSELHNKRISRIQTMFKSRTELVRRECDENRHLLRPEPPAIQNIIWSMSPRHNLLMCRTAKHGSTTWANIFVQILSQRLEISTWGQVLWHPVDSFSHSLNMLNITK